MIKNYPTIKQTEEKEEILRGKILELNEEDRLKFYSTQQEKIKDPDTYATLNYMFFLGLHHLYSGQYKTFLVEFTAIILSIILIYSEVDFLATLGASGIIAILIYQASQLFMSQRIVRHRNYEISIEIYNNIINPSKVYK